MKILSRPIDVICVFIDDTDPKPVKWRMRNSDGTDTVVKVDHIYSVQRDRVRDINFIIYRCQGNVNGVERRYELKFNYKDLKWFLWKM